MTYKDSEQTTIQFRIDRHTKQVWADYAREQGKTVTSLIIDTVEDNLKQTERTSVQVPPHKLLEWSEFADKEGLPDVDALVITAVNDYIRERGV